MKKTQCLLKGGNRSTLRKRPPAPTHKHPETARLFRELRAELDLTQEDFAERVGISQPLVCKIEKGHQPPSLKAFLLAYQEACKHGRENEKSMIEFEAFMGGPELSIIGVF